MGESQETDGEERHMEIPQRTLVELLENYESWDDVEEGHRQQILTVVRQSPRWWHRRNLPGHVTASGFVTDPSLSFLLLHHHRKLDRWLQLGGHDDGEKDPRQAVLREVREESGLSDFSFFGEGTLFDLDVHTIPDGKKMEAHLHLDCRFLLVADPTAPLAKSEAESKDLGWFPLEEAIDLMNEVGARRVVEKIRSLKSASSA